MINNLFSQKRTSKIYYFSLIAREDCEVDGKGYEAGDVIKVLYYDDLRQQRKAAKKIDISNKIEGYTDFIRLQTYSSSVVKPIEWRELFFTEEERDHIQVIPGQLSEDRVLICNAANSHVTELIDTIGLSEQQKLATRQFFFDPVRWEVTKEKLLAKRNREQDN